MNENLYKKPSTQNLACSQQPTVINARETISCIFRFQLQIITFDLNLVRVCVTYFQLNYDNAIYIYTCRYVTQHYEICASMRAIMSTPSMGSVTGTCAST